MRLYLSSFRMGRCPERLLNLTRGGRRAAVIANATDVYALEDRAEGVARELGGLRDLGFEPVEFDLRTYFEDPADHRLIAEELRRYDLVWVRGGDVFTLRYSLKRSGADAALVRLLAEDVIAYGGYSAGICVLAPTLRGLEGVDDPAWLKALYGEEPIWDGLGLLEYRLVPHVGSPEHPESERCQEVAKQYLASGIPHLTLRDGDVIVIDGDREEVCTG